MATATKEMWVANLVEFWRGDHSSVPVHEFFESVDEAAEMGWLSAKDKVRLARLKLKGIAKAFYFTQPERKGDEIEYADLKQYLCRDLKTSRPINIIILDYRTLLRKKMRDPRCI
jgi:hypothetical protein